MNLDDNNLLSFSKHLKYTPTWNQVKIRKDSESRRRKFQVAGPSEWPKSLAFLSSSVAWTSARPEWPPLAASPIESNIFHIPKRAYSPAFMHLATDFKLD